MEPRKLEEFKRLEADVKASYPDLRLVIRGERPVFKGSFPVRHEGAEIDRFSIEVSFPGGIRELPIVKEVGGRIPKDKDRHVNPETGDICTDVPELILLKGYTSLVSYLDGPVRNFFISQIVFESGRPWPFGQWDHGKDGLLQAYGELLDVTGEDQIVAYLEYLSAKKVKPHWTCPCGTGRQVRSCHAKEIATLREAIPRGIAMRALTRLKAAIALSLASQ